MNHTFKRFLKPTGHVLSTAVLTSASVDALFTHPSHAEPVDSPTHANALTQSSTSPINSTHSDPLVSPEASTLVSDRQAESPPILARPSALSLSVADANVNAGHNANLESDDIHSHRVVTDRSDPPSIAPLPLESLTEDLAIDLSRDDSPSVRRHRSQDQSDAAATPVGTGSSSSWDDSLEASRQRLEEKLAQIVQQERSDREAEFRQNLMAIATRHVHAGNLTAARQIAQNPVLTDADQDHLLELINNMPASTTAARSVAPAPPTESRPNSQHLPGNAPRLGWEIATQRQWQRPNTVSLTPLCQLSGVSGTTRSVQNQYQPLARGTRQQSPILRETSSAPLRHVSRSTNWSAYSLDRQPSCTERVPSIADVPTSFFTSNWLPEPSHLEPFQMIFPLAIPAPITSTFGWRTHPIFGGRRFHYGIDFGAPTGTPVLAALPGYVETSSYLDGYGLTVVIENQDVKQRNLYAHLSEIAVTPGTWVEQGTIIGWVGSTGNSTGPHLHFEVHQLGDQGWVAVDPMLVSPSVRLGAR